MLEYIVSKHHFDTSFRELPSCFYRRTSDLEETFCVPATTVNHGPWIGELMRPFALRPYGSADIQTDVSYTIRYPELKTSGEKPEWALRQSGIYQRFNRDTLQSVVVLFNPTPNSKAHQRAEEWLLSYGNGATENPFYLHDILFSAHLPAWRQYIAWQERQALAIVSDLYSLN